MLKFLSFMSMVLIGPMSLAQYAKYGVIYPQSSALASQCCVHFPKESPVQIYSGPSGEQKGHLMRYKVEDQSNYSSFRLVYIQQQDTLEINYEDIKEVDYEMAAITYSDFREGFVKILNSQGNLWVKRSDFDALAFKVLSYQELLQQKSGEVLGLYPEYNLNLRSSPSLAGKKIETLGHLHEISLTGEHKGQWSKVKVVKLKENRCEGGDNLEEYELEGWIKIIDKEGNLNVWYYTRGC